jgi:hypothetical protein
MTVGDATLVTPCTAELNAASFTGEGVAVAVEVTAPDVAAVEEDTTTERTTTDDGATDVELGKGTAAFEDDTAGVGDSIAPPSKISV